MRHKSSTLWLSVVVTLALAPVALAQSPKMNPDMQKKMRMFVNSAQADGYLKSHNGEQNPKTLLGGPIHTTITQDGGGVFVALPDHRRLDAHVFGTPMMPRWNGGTPGISGLPFPARGVEGGHYTAMKPLSPFGDKYITMGGASLKLELTDITATDAAKTQDSAKLVASWKDAKGNQYTVKCCLKMAAHGLEFPTFGGVVTNHLLHGFTGLGTPLMPTEFAYAAFWGMGMVSKNGKVLEKPRLVHGMLTEYVRAEGYKLAADAEVTPSRWQFHLMVPPMKPVPAETRYQAAPVNTGLTLPNGRTLPFWHVMFESIKVGATRE